MNKKATIRLGRGNVGFYDELTRIHLTIASPFADVYEGMNTTNLERGVRYNTIEVVEGSLSVESPMEEGHKEDVVAPETEHKEDTPPVQEETQPQEDNGQVPETLEEPIVKEESEEEVVEEKKTRKRSAKTTKTKSTKDETK